jgi:hypothetical protein
MLMSRIRHLVVVAVVVALGSISATSGAGGAQPNEAPRGIVSIHLKGYLDGPQVAAVGRGRFTASGAFSDRGSFVDVFHGVHPPGEPHVLTLNGGKGTIVIDVDRKWPVADRARDEGPRRPSRAWNPARAVFGPRPDRHDAERDGLARGTRDRARADPLTLASARATPPREGERERRSDAETEHGPRHREAR